MAEMIDKETMVTFSFIFDPAETWTRYYQLEQDLADFLESKGMEANKVAMKGSGQKVYRIVRKPEFGKPQAAVYIPAVEKKKPIKELKREEKAWKAPKSGLGVLKPRKNNLFNVLKMT